MSSQRENERKTYALFRVWDVFVLLLVLGLVAAALFMILLPSRGRTAEVFLDGEKVMTLRLDKDAVILLEHLTLHVEDGELWVEDADCPDKICEKTGRISKKGQNIVCLPNRVVIKIAGKGEVEAIT
ncbi:MAG: NusG domain II-containing protein [Clostridia bacterium]|nr:NusG domain II-containing protein [Clostridia bacterium]